MSLAASCSYAYKKAKEPELKALLAKTLFKKLYIRDGKIIKAELNEPLTYLCESRIKKNPVFDLVSLGGCGADRTHDPLLKRQVLYH